MSEGDDFIQASQQDDFERLMTQYQRLCPTEGCNVRMQRLSAADCGLGTPNGLRENIENFVRDLGNIEQTRDAGGDQLTALRTIWTQLAIALAPTSSARRSTRRAGNKNKRKGTESERILAAERQGAADAHANEQHAHLLHLSTSQLAFNYTFPNLNTRLRIRSTTPKHYCMLEIHAHNDTNSLGSFQIWWVPGEDNLVIFYFHIPAGQALPPAVAEAVAARRRHAQAGAAEVRPGGGDDVPEHNNAAAARAASDSNHDAGVIEAAEVRPGGGDDVPEHNNAPAARAASDSNHDARVIVAAGGDGETQSDSDDEKNDEAQRSSAAARDGETQSDSDDEKDAEAQRSPAAAGDGETHSDSDDEKNAEAQRSSAGNSSSESSDSDHDAEAGKKYLVHNPAPARGEIDPEKYPARPEHSPLPTPRSSEKSFDADENNAEAQRSSAGNSSSESSDSDHDAEAGKKYLVHNPGQARGEIDPEEYPARAEHSPYPTPRSSEKSFDAADDVAGADAIDAGERKKAAVENSVQYRQLLGIRRRQTTKTQGWTGTRTTES
jgi:hypothetical protein